MSIMLAKSEKLTQQRERLLGTPLSLGSDDTWCGRPQLLDEDQLQRGEESTGAQRGLRGLGGSAELHALAEENVEKGGREGRKKRRQREAMELEGAEEACTYVLSARCCAAPSALSDDPHEQMD